MKQLFFLIFFFSCFFSKGQINKSNWLFGGSGAVTSQVVDRTVSLDNVNAFNLNLSPNIGYFFIDRFAAGLKPSINFQKLKYSGVTDKYFTLGIGPFLRYYLLKPTNRRLNILTDLSYQHTLASRNKEKLASASNKWNLSAGAAIFFNSSVALEILPSYEIYKIHGGNKANTFSILLGFQIHLEKNKE